MSKRGSEETMEEAAANFVGLGLLTAFKRSRQQESKSVVVATAPKVCYRCDSSHHFEGHCPFNGRCFLCQSPDHKALNCPQKLRQGQSSSRGHVVRGRGGPPRGRGSGAGMARGGCYSCGRYGHLARNCHVGRGNARTDGDEFTGSRGNRRVQPARGVAQWTRGVPQMQQARSVMNRGVSPVRAVVSPIRKALGSGGSAAPHLVSAQRPMSYSEGRASSAAAHQSSCLMNFSNGSANADHPMEVDPDQPRTSTPVKSSVLEALLDDTQLTATLRQCSVAELEDELREAAQQVEKRQLEQQPTDEGSDTATAATTKFI